MKVRDIRKVREMAQLVASGWGIGEAAEACGWSRNTGYKISKLDEYKKVLEECNRKEIRKIESISKHDRTWIDAQMRIVYERCIKVNDIKDPCPKCHTKFERMLDTREAVKLLEMWGLEQGMFKRHVDVTTRKGAMIEGTQKEILQRFSDLLLRLGIPAMAQLLDMLDPVSLVEALSQIGYKVKKTHGRDNGGPVARSAGDTGDGRESDALRLPAVPEAAALS